MLMHKSHLLDANGRLLVMLIVFFSAWANFISIGYWQTPVTFACVNLFLMMGIDVALRGKLPVSRQDFLLFCYTLMILASVLWAPFPAKIWQYSYWWLLSFSAYLGVRRYCTSESTFEWFAKVSIAGALVATSKLHQGVGEWGNKLRYDVSGENANFVAYVLAGSVLALCVLLTFFSPKKVVWILSSAVIGIIAFAIFKLETRGAMISTIGVVAITFFGQLVRGRFAKILAVGCLLLSIAFSVGAIDFLLLLMDRLSSRETGDLAGRLAIWPIARSVIFENPVVGIGPGQFQYVNSLGVAAHNFFLTIPLETGIIGSILMISFSVLFYRELSAKIARPHGPRLLLMFCAYWLPIATSGEWDLTPYSWMMVAFILNVNAYLNKGPRRFEGNPPPPFLTGAKSGVRWPMQVSALG